MSHYDESDTSKSGFYGPYRKPRSTKKTFTRNFVVDVNENVLIINPGSDNQIVFQRPPLTYAEILKQIISKNSDKKLQLSDIYRLMAQKYPYFQHAPMDWRNSIRNCLSTNSIFKNINTYDSNGFRQRYWVLNEDATNTETVSSTASNTTNITDNTVNSLISVNNDNIFNFNNIGTTENQNVSAFFPCNVDNNEVNSQACIALGSNYENTTSGSTIYHTKPNLNHTNATYSNYYRDLYSINDDNIYSNYMNIFCTEFFYNNCIPCQLIHNIGKKYSIQCGCPHCLCTNDRKKSKLNDDLTDICSNNYEFPPSYGPVFTSASSTHLNEPNNSNKKSLTPESSRNYTNYKHHEFYNFPFLTSSNNNSQQNNKMDCSSTDDEHSY